MSAEATDQAGLSGPSYERIVRNKWIGHASRSPEGCMHSSRRLGLLLWAGVAAALPLFVLAPAGLHRVRTNPDAPEPRAASCGVLDYSSTDEALAPIERLVQEERHVEAFRRSVDLLRDRAMRLGPLDPATLET